MVAEDDDDLDERPDIHYAMGQTPPADHLDSRSPAAHRHIVPAEGETAVRLDPVLAERHTDFVGGGAAAGVLGRNLAGSGCVRNPVAKPGFGRSFANLGVGRSFGGSGFVRSSAAGLDSVRSFGAAQKLGRNPGSRNTAVAGHHMCYSEACCHTDFAEEGHYRIEKLEIAVGTAIVDWDMATAAAKTDWNSSEAYMAHSTD